MLRLSPRRGSRKRKESFLGPSDEFVCDVRDSPQVSSKGEYFHKRSVRLRPRHQRVLGCAKNYGARAALTRRGGSPPIPATWRPATVPLRQPMFGRWQAVGRTSEFVRLSAGGKGLQASGLTFKEDRRTPSSPLRFFLRPAVPVAVVFYLRERRLRT